MIIKQQPFEADRALRVIEASRKKWEKAHTLMQGFLITILVAFFLMFFSNIIQSIPVPVRMILIFLGVAAEWVGWIGLIVSAIIQAVKSKEYGNTYKQMLSKYVLQESFENPVYDPLNGFTVEDFKAGHLIKWRDNFRYSSEDLIRAQYNGVEFQQADVRITHETGGKNRRTVVDIDGRLIRIKFHKPIGSRIVIATDEREVALEDKLSKVEMEDMEFNREFDVFSEDGHSVFYLLTPQFMGYLKELRVIDSFLFISFDGEDLYVLRSGKGGIFEPPHVKYPIDLEYEAEKNRKELREIKNIIEVLQLSKDE